MKRLSLLLLALGLAARIGAGEAPDPWAPGAGLEPWPLITSLQRYAAPSDPEPDWPGALRHEDPLVRAAAAAALGRVPDPRRRGQLDLLLADRVALVRQTAQWAALQQAGEPTAELMARILSEPWQHYGIAGGILPPGGAGHMSTAQKREWLRTLPSGPLRPAPRDVPWEATLDRVTVSARRSEYDADEIVELAARVVVGRAHKASTWPLPSSIAPRDPWREPSRPEPPPDPSRTPSMEVSVRVVADDGSGRLPLVPSSDRVVPIAFDLEELPPDVYTFTFGNPLFLRVRRSATAEEQGLAAARDPVKSAEALATVSRLRVRAAAPALEQHFTQSLATYGFGFNTWRDTLALARLAAPEAADLVLPPLLAARGFEDPYTSRTPDLAWLLTGGFGGGARQRLDPFVSGWRQAVEQGQHESISRLLADPSYGPGTAVDAARVDVLRQLGHLYDTDVVNDYQQRSVLAAAVRGAAPDHPAAIAPVLARLASRAGVLAQSLQGLTDALDAPAATRLVRAVWDALPVTPGVADDARAALAAEAQRLGVPLPAAPQGRATAKEVERQLRQALGHGTTPAGVDRAVTLGRELLAREPSPIVALLVAEAEMERGRWEEAARIVPDPASLPSDSNAGNPARRAHAIRGRAAAARGALAEAAQELAAAGAVSAYTGYQDLTKYLAERIAQLGPDAEGRVRLRPLPSVGGDRASWTGRAFGRFVFSLTDAGELRRFDPNTGTSLTIGRAPVPIREWVAVGDEAVVVAGRNTVFRLDAGRAVPTWSQPYAPDGNSDGVALVADASVTLVKDGMGVRAWSTEAPTRGVWRIDRVSRFVIVPGSAGGVLVVQSDPEARPDLSERHLPRGVYLRLLDASSGRARWSTPLRGQPERVGVGGRLGVLWGPDDVMAAFDLGDGHRLWARDFHVKNQWLTANNGIDYVVAVNGDRVYLRNRTTLLGLSPEDGQTLWTVPFAQHPAEASGSVTDQKLVAVDDGSVWWLGDLVAPARVAVARLVDRDGVVRLSPPATGGRDAPTVLPDGTLLVHPPYGAFLEAWAHR